MLASSFSSFRALNEKRRGQFDKITLHDDDYDDDHIFRDDTSDEDVYLDELLEGEHDDEDDLQINHNDNNFHSSNGNYDGDLTIGKVTNKLFSTQKISGSKKDDHIYKKSYPVVATEKVETATGSDDEDIYNDSNDSIECGDDGVDGDDDDDDDDDVIHQIEKRKKGINTSLVKNEITEVTFKGSNWQRQVVLIPSSDIETNSSTTTYKHRTDDPSESFQGICCSDDTVPSPVSPVQQLSFSDSKMNAVANDAACATTKKKQIDSGGNLNKIELPMPNIVKSPASRKKYSSLQTLPTLEEIADDDSTFTNKSTSKLQKQLSHQNNANFPSSGLDSNDQHIYDTTFQISLSISNSKKYNDDIVGESRLSPRSAKKKPYVPRSKKPTRLDQVRELQATASDLAQRGDEDESLKVYRRALQIAGSEMSRIQSFINKGKHLNPTYKSKSASSNAKIGTPLPIAAIKSIQNRIQEDLLKVSERIGKIRIVMTILHERIGEYDKAIECCKGATEVYQHQQLLLRENEVQRSSKEINSNKESSTLGGKQKFPTQSTESEKDNYLKSSKDVKDRLLESRRMLVRLNLGKQCLEERAQAAEEMAGLRYEICQLNYSRSRSTDTMIIEKKQNELYQRLYEIGRNQLKREKDALGKSHPQLVDVLQLLASLALENSRDVKYNVAIEHLKDALKICKSALGVKHPKTAQVYLKLARIHRSIHDIHSKNHSKDNDISSDHEELSLQNFFEAAATLRLCKLRPTLLGSTLNDLAIIYMKRRDFNKAIDLLKEALQQYDANKESLTTSVAIDLAATNPKDVKPDSKFNSNSRKGSYWFNTNSGPHDEGDAIGSSTERVSGSEIDPTGYNNAGISQKGNLSIDALQVWRNLGESYYQVERYDDAKDAFANALEIQRSTRTIHDAVAELDLGIVGVQEGMLKLVDDASIVDTLSRLGKACAAAGKHQDALFAHKDSLELMNRIAVEEELNLNLTNQQVLLRRHLLSKTLYCIANACTELSDYKEALKYYSESIQHSRLGAAAAAAVPSSNPMERRRLQNERLLDAAHCGLCFMGIADVHLKKERLPEALKVYNDALKYCEMKGLGRDHSVVSALLEKKKEVEARITELPRSNAEIARLEARALQEMSAGQLDESILTLTEAMGILRSSFAQAKLAGFDSSEHLCAISRMLQTLASVFLEKGEEENAERVFQDAVRIFNQSGAHESLDL